MNPSDIKTYDAEAVIAAKRIVKFGTNDYGVVQAAAADDALIGLVVSPLGAAAGTRIDIAHAGIGEVQLGGTVAAGAFVTADAAGKGVAAAPAAGVNNRVVGIALVGGDENDIIPVKIDLGVVQGAA